MSRFGTMRSIRSSWCEQGCLEQLHSAGPEIVANAAKEAMAWNKQAARKGLEDSQEAIDFLKSKGMKVVTLTPAEWTPSRQR